jgi:hypothetical protein
MIAKNSRVKVLDNYSGGLDNVKGRSAKIVSTEVDGQEVKYLLDIKGDRTHTYNYGGAYGERSYTTQYPVIVEASEIEEEPYNFKDRDGQVVELGDIVVYATHGGGLIKGTVVDFKDTVYPRWGTERKELKMKLEIEHTYGESDGGDRRVSKKSTYTQWLASQGSTLIFQKNPARNFFISKDFLIQDA